MGWGWQPYVSVAERRASAQRKMDKLRKQGVHVQGIEIEGRKIARTFWGEKWCQHLESLSDYKNRLPRGRSYVRNGSVCHLEISAGEVKAMVSGSELYDVSIKIKPLIEQKWCAVKERCSGKIGSLLELLQGRLSTSVMKMVTDQREGLFPLPAEIKLHCSCPDRADMCKHVAAVLYGVGARLDEKPELLFLLRGVDHEELIDTDAAIATSTVSNKQGRRHIAENALGDIFGIEMLAEETAPAVQRASGSRSITRKNSVTQAATRIISNQAADDSVTNDSFTAQEIRKLREKLDLSQSELAVIVGVTAASVRNWESRSGVLNLHARNLQALKATGRLTKKQVLARLSES